MALRTLQKREQLRYLFLAASKALVNAIQRKDREAAVLYGRCMVEARRAHRNVSA